MRVHVDPAGRDQQSVGSDVAPRRPQLAADRSDPAARNRNVAGECWRAGTVNDGTAANDDVVHGSLPEMSQPMMRRWDAENNGPGRARNGQRATVKGNDSIQRRANG